MRVNIQRQYESGEKNLLSLDSYVCVESEKIDDFEHVWQLTSVDF